MGLTSRESHRAAMTGKNLWRLTKFYGRLIGVSALKPRDLRHGVAMEMYGKHGDLEKVRRCSVISGLTRRRSTRRPGRRNSSARLTSTTRKQGGCSTLRRERCVVFEEVCALQREVLQTSSRTPRRAPAQRRPCRCRSPATPFLRLAQIQRSRLSTLALSEPLAS